MKRKKVLESSSKMLIWFLLLGREDLVLRLVPNCHSIQQDDFLKNGIIKHNITWTFILENVVNFAILELKDFNIEKFFILDQMPVLKLKLLKDVCYILIPSCISKTDFLKSISYTCLYFLLFVLFEWYVHIFLSIKHQCKR